MGWFKKKKEDEDIPKLPELPELPDLPETLSSSSESLPDVPPGLPEIETKLLIEQPREEELEFPEMPSETETFDREAARLEINEPVIPVVQPKLATLARVSPQTRPSVSREIPVSPRTLKPSMSTERGAEIGFRRIESGLDYEPERTLEVPPSRMSLANPKMTKKIEPVFVRLDKFQMTIQTFEEIKLKLEEIEEILKKTRDIKIKEEQELIDWEREIQVIKSRIEMIDRSVLNKLD